MKLLDGIYAQVDANQSSICICRPIWPTLLGENEMVGQSKEHEYV